MTQTEWIISLDDDLKDFDEMFVGNARDGDRLTRCKDCIFWEHAFDNWGKCYGIMAGLGTYESGYCAWAERAKE